MHLAVTNTIYSLFNSSSWRSLNIPTYPSNYNQNITDKEFIRFNILTGRTALNYYGVGKKSFGLIIISIFVESGIGEKRIAEIATHLDTLLQYKAFDNGIGLGTSSLAAGSIDEVQKSLYRTEYTINMTYIGE
jgi:hypothetical protein